MDRFYVRDIPGCVRVFAVETDYAVPVLKEPLLQSVLEVFIKAIADPITNPVPLQRMADRRQLHLPAFRKSQHPVDLLDRNTLPKLLSINIRYFAFSSAPTPPMLRRFWRKVFPGTHAIRGTLDEKELVGIGDATETAREHYGNQCGVRSILRWQNKTAPVFQCYLSEFFGIFRVELSNQPRASREQNTVVAQARGYNPELDVYHVSVKFEPRSRAMQARPECKLVPATYQPLSGLVACV